MTARAYVQHDFAGFGVAVWLGEKLSDDRFALARPVELISDTMSSSEAAAVHEPTLRLRDDMARALLDVLAAHYGGTSDVQTLRKDYLAERARVDKMIGYLTQSDSPASPKEQR